MTSGRFWLPCIPLSVSLALLASPGCGGGGSQACIECPPIEGRYTLELGQEAPPPTCSGLGEEFPAGPLEVERTGSHVTARLDEMTLSGTLYVTYDFNLVGIRSGAADGGTGGPESASLSGRYIPALGDGGVPRLVGTWQGSYAGTPGGESQRCLVTRSFTAIRQQAGAP